jgi:DNA invertase Pin-like site-specific DNA recombinase
MKQAVMYLRRSTDRQEQSIGDQRRVIQEWAGKNSYALVREFVDDAISGETAENRSSFQQMIEFVEAAKGKVSAVLVYDISRFGRTDSDESGFYRYRIRKAGALVIYVTENLPKDRVADLILSVKQFQTREYLVSLSRDTLRGLLTRAMEGYSTGRPTPYGYNRALLDTNGNLLRVIRKGEQVRKEKSDKVRLVKGEPTEVAVVEGIFETYAQGKGGFRTIADTLNQRGIPAPYGERWRPSQIRSVLTNPVYKGWMVFNRHSMGKFYELRKEGIRERQERRIKVNPESEWIVVRDAHEALVSEEVFDKVQSMLGERRRTVTNKEIVRSPYLLTGLVYCGNCGARMSGSRYTRRKSSRMYEYPVYCCSSYINVGRTACTPNRISRDALEKFVLDKIVESFGLNERMEKIREAVRSRFAALLPKQDGGSAEVIRRKIAEIDRKAAVLVDTIAPENACFVNEKLTSLRKEKEQRQVLLGNVEQKERTAGDIEQAVEHTVALLHDLHAALRDEHVGLVKDLLKAVVSKVEIRFKTEREGKRYVSRIEKGVLELNGVAGSGGGSYSPYHSGGGI